METEIPGSSAFTAVVFGLAVTWAGLVIAYYSIYPVGFWVTSLSFGVYVLARIWRAVR